ncbi:MAG: PEP-CTERM system TPR-repeat protein PrsT [Pseudomonadales bacterium]
MDKPYNLNRCSFLLFISLTFFLTPAVSNASSNYYKDAQNYYTQGDYNSAIIQLKNVLQDNPEDIKARILLGDTYLKIKRPLDAVKELEKAQSIDADETGWAALLSTAYLNSGQLDKLLAMESLPHIPETEKALVLANIGHGKLLKRDIEGASARFEEALTLSETPIAIVGKARIALLEARFEDSKALAERALAQAPENLDALFTKAQAQSNLGEIEDAIKTFEKLLSIDPKRHQARYMKANLDLALGNIEQARSDVDLILKEKPDYAPANIVRARLYLMNNDFALAQQAAEKVLRHIPEHLMTHYVSGASHYAQQNYEQAKIYLEKFLGTVPSHTVATRLLGAVYLELGDEQAAIDLIESFNRQYQKEDAKLLSILGTAYLTTGDFEKGITALNRSLELDPNIHDSRINLAYGYIASGDLDKASEGLETFAQMTSNSEKAYTLLILTYLKQQNFDEALRLANRSLENYPDTPTFYILKGRTLEAQGNVEAAERVYTDALKAKIDHLPIHFALAQLHLKARQNTQAREHFLKMNELEPGHLDASINLAQLANAENDQKSAIKWMERAKDYHPESIKPVNLLVTYYLSMGDTLKALNEANRFYSQNPNDLEAISLMALVYSARKDYPSAKEFLSEILAKSPTDINHRLQLAQVHFVSKEYDQALTRLHEVLQLEPGNIAALVAETRIHLKEGNIAEARKTRELLVNYYPDNYVNDQLLGDILVAENNSTGAITAYQRAFEQQKTDYLLDVLLDLYAENKQPNEAIKLLEQFLLAFPSDNYARLKLAAMYQQLELNKKAIAQYEQLAKALPDNALVLNNLSWLYWLDGNASALDTAGKAFQITSDNPDIADTYGWIMLHEGNKREALKILQAAASSAPQKPGIRYHLAKALADNGQNDQAKKELSRVLRDYPAFEQKTAAMKLQEELSQTR